MVGRLVTCALGAGLRDGAAVGRQVNVGIMVTLGAGVGRRVAVNHAPASVALHNATWAT